LKIPVSTLVVIHTPDLQVLLLERADHAGYWQSVTGSQDAGETLVETAIREVAEETGLDARQFVLSDWRRENLYDIYPGWRHRYALGVTHNTEHVFGLTLPAPIAIQVSRRASGFVWLPGGTLPLAAFLGPIASDSGTPQRLGSCSTRTPSGATVRAQDGFCRGSRAASGL
jgi:dATP pyrophosphohydrolase